ncbi:MAG: tRNA pseudouridine(38-40) synthase TruA [Clostridia bacterium]|nr:tRNA pseudouridine(38-40) synthase TruA [Clostridia bacterium]
MRRIRCIIQYDGTNYVGWQVQPNGVSVQEKIEAALFKVVKEKVRIHGSGRTDSGVHARAQVAHFDTEAKMPADKLAIALNGFLPPDIRILYSEQAPDDFHARFSAKKKQYRYTIQLGAHADVFLRNTALHLHSVPDVALMDEAAKLCLGEHDFRSFMAVNTKMENTVRELYVSKWTQDGNLLHYDVEGNGFLYNMVRILVGTMLEIGRGRLPVSAMSAALLAADRTNAGATAPAHGLMLMRVCYPDFDTQEVLGRVL